MSVTVDDLDRRVRDLEEEVRRLRTRPETPTNSLGIPQGSTILDWFAQLRREKAACGTLDDARRALGLPTGVPPVGAKRVREMMLDAGIRPEECLASREIIRMREE